MHLERFESDPSLISLDIKDILSFLEREKAPLEKHTIELVEEYIPRCTATATPQGGYVWLEKIRWDTGDRLGIGNEEFNVGPIISSKLKHAELMVLFAVTAGPGPETMARELIGQGAYPEGYMVDLIGTAITEWTADQIHQKIEAQAGTTGLKVTNRYSPGYCSWKVEEQQKLFRLIPPETCGIVLSESSLMTPIKSVSGIIGVGKKVTFSANSCEVCPMKNCSFRRITK